MSDAAVIERPAVSAGTRSNGVARRLRNGGISVLWALAGIGLVVLMWELVKWLGQYIPMPFNTSDMTMPHVWTMVAAMGEPEVRGSDTTVLEAVISAAFRSMTLAVGGFIIGVSVGLLLAVIMQRFLFAERGLLPFVIASQTVPLIALAPLIVGIGNRIEIGPVQWTTTYSVMFIAAYLAFFPLSVGALRGLQAPSATSLELMRSYAATPGQMLRKLRFPSSIPYLVPALKVSAAASVVGTVVAEISTGVRGGIGRMLIEYARQITSQPAKVYVAVFGAIALGLLVAALVTALDVYLTRNLPKESKA
ncbi:MAG: ABC transporter permease subunit [Actinomycetota bacterium]|nr:ABC transporter permease subunit [Actinomycetota bacterium]